MITLSKNRTTQSFFVKNDVRSAWILQNARIQARNCHVYEQTIFRDNMSGFGARWQSIARLFLLVTSFYAILFPALPAAQAEALDHATIKQALLDDPLFLSHLRDRLSASTMDDDHIRLIVRNYLLDNPELLLEVQQALSEKQDGFERERQQEAAQIITENAAFLFDKTDDMILGNAQGNVTIVEFYDYNCGYCKSSYPDNLALLAKDNNIKLVMKDYPILGEDSGQAHLVAHAFKKLMPQHYPAFHHEMMTRNIRATLDSTIELALKYGVNKERLLEAAGEESLQAPLVETSRIAYQLGINFTPAYIIGSEILRGAADQAIIMAAVEAQRKQAH